MITELYTVYRAELLKYCCMICGNASDIEDLLQETFMKALSNLDLLEELGEKERRAWLYKVARNLFYDACRRRTVEQKNQMQVEEQYQFKEAKNRFDSGEAARCCCALANCGGGKLVFGITDKRPRKVVGSKAFDQPERTRKGLIDKLKVMVDFQLLYDQNGNRVLVFDVSSRPLGLPVQVDGVAWWYEGDSLIPMPEGIRRRIYDETGFDFSGSICTAAVYSDLDENAIEDFRDRWIEKSGNKRLSSLSIKQLLHDCEAINDGGITYAALILFGKRESLGRLLPQAEIVFEYRSSNVPGPANHREEFRMGFFACYKQSAASDCISFSQSCFSWLFRDADDHSIPASPASDLLYMPSNIRQSYRRYHSFSCELLDMVCRLDIDPDERRDLLCYYCPYLDDSSGCYCTVSVLLRNARMARYGTCLSMYYLRESIYGTCDIRTYKRITYLQEYLLTVFGGYIGTLFILCAAMFLSALTRSAVIAVFLPVAVLFLPTFIGNLTSVSGILGLLPDQLLQIGYTAAYFNVYEIGGTIVGAIPILFILYPVMLTALIPGMYWVYRKTKVY